MIEGARMRGYIYTCILVSSGMSRVVVCLGARFGDLCGCNWSLSSHLASSRPGLRGKVERRRRSRPGCWR
jgi:hypothetical protein